MEKQASNNFNKKCDRTFQYIAAVAASLATFCTGTVFGWPSLITDDLLSGELGFPLTPNDLGWICSCSSIGAALLTLFIGPICDRIGRKTAMLLLVTVFELGWALIIFSTEVWMLILGRFFTGMAGGSYCVTVSLYIAEVAVKEVRGALGGLTQLMISCGILFANVLGAFASTRVLSVACAMIPVLFGAVLLYMPETPVYLLRKGRDEECKATLEKLLGKVSVEEEYEELKAHLKCGTTPLTTMEVIKKRSVRRACVIGVGLALLKIFSGIDPVTSYLSHIFKETNTLVEPENACIVFAVSQVLAVVPQVLLVDRLGRRILLITSQMLMALALGTTALSLLFRNEDPVLEYVPLVALCLFIVGFSIGIGPIGWIITAEIFDEEVKGRAMSVCTFLVWFLAFVNVKMFEILEEEWNVSVPLLVYCGVSSAGAFFVWARVPETKNKSFAEIEKELTG
ncbi:hypothetical protein NQ315_017289 [Exocentrus adspersus]|uniref:Major facilitator superfamily (MFS) profile domain-containing protein n=1 Tax=Exocentrus adspersus TaxID=1586481 RepID=A0AAV8VK94_9CUCU|nr:hypothetical protein NQ315_017289 [Exocentrus adspersus]